MIRRFRDSETEKVYQGEFSKKFHAIARVAQRKLEILDGAHVLHDLAIFPGNHLEALGRSRQGQHAIRINRQYRICFVWSEPDAFDVEIVDYHDEKK